MEQLIFSRSRRKCTTRSKGGEIDLSSIKKEIYEQVIYENSFRNFLEHDFVIVHDPQPLPLIEHYEKNVGGSGAAISIFPDRIRKCGSTCDAGSTSTMQPSSAVPNTNKR